MFGSVGTEAAWVMGKNFGAGTSFVAAVDELIVVQNCLRTKLTVQAEKEVTD